MLKWKLWWWNRLTYNTGKQGWDGKWNLWKSWQYARCLLLSNLFMICVFHDLSWFMLYVLNDLRTNLHNSQSGHWGWCNWRWGYTCTKRKLAQPTDVEVEFLLIASEDPNQCLTLLEQCDIIYNDFTSRHKLPFITFISPYMHRF